MFAVIVAFVISETLPREYNFLKAYPECDFGPMHQNCGNCYGYAAVKVLSHRFCRALGRRVELSPQYVTACDIANNGCIGGTERNAYYFMEQFGITEVECHPWQNVRSYSLEYCGKCVNQSHKYNLYKGLPWSTKHFEGVDVIKREIYEHGPLSVCMSFPAILHRYGSGIYATGPVNDNAGNHSLELIGWGEKGNVKYWILLNNHGTGWGMNGTMHVRLGQNDALVESFVYGIDPDLSSLAHDNIE